MFTTMLTRVARGPRGLATGSWALAEATFARHELVRSPCGSRSLRTVHITSFRDEVSLQDHEKRRRRGLELLPAATTTSRGFSSTTGEEKRETWHEKQNAQGRVFYENASTGTRSWERPSPDVAVVKSLAEVEIEEEERREREAREAARAKRKEYKGDSLMMRVVDNFWRVVDLARRAYWAGIVAAAIYFLSELYKDFA